MNQLNSPLLENFAVTPESRIFTTLGARYRADQVKLVKTGSPNRYESLVSDTTDDSYFTTGDQAMLIELLSADVQKPLTRRELRQQEHDANIKNHPIRHLGHRALLGLLKPFSR